MYNSVVPNSGRQNKADTQQQIYENSLFLTWDTPTWEQELQDITVQEREKAVQLVCKCGGLLHPSAKWFHKGREVFSDFHMKLKQEAETATLIIKSIREQDSGKFKCVMTGENGEIETSCTLSIKAIEIVEPAVFVKELHDMEVAEGEKLELDVEVREVEHPESPNFVICPLTLTAQEGETVTFACQVKGQPMPTVLWERGGVVIATNQKYKITKIQDQHMLAIYNIDQTDAGEYICHLHNTQGDLSHACALHVIRESHPGGPDPAETVTSRSDHIQSLHLTLQTEQKSSVKGDNVSASPLVSRRIRNQQLKDKKDTSKYAEEETISTKKSYKTSFETVLGTAATSVHSSTVPQTAHRDLYRDNQDQQKLHLDYHNHNSKYEKKQPDMSTIHISEHLVQEDSGIHPNLPQTVTTFHSVLNKSQKKVEEKINMINSDVTDFRSVLKHREKSHSPYITKTGTTQSHEVNFRKVISGDKTKQHFETETKKGYVSVNVPSAQISHIVLSQNTESELMSHPTSSSASSTNHSQSPKNLAYKRTEATVSDHELTTVQKNVDNFRDMDVSSASSIQFSSTGRHGHRRRRSNSAYSPSSSQHFEKLSNEQEFPVSSLVKNSKDSLNIAENKQQNATISHNHFLTRDKNQQRSQDKSVGENLSDSVREEKQSEFAETRMGAMLFKSKVEVLETRTPGERGNVTSTFPHSEQSFNTSLNARIGSPSARSEVRSESYLTDGNILDLESETYTVTPESQKEDTVQSHKVSVVHFNPQMSSAPLKPEKLEVTSVSLSLPLRPSVSSPQLHSQSLSNALSGDLLGESSTNSTDTKHEDMDDVFTNLTEERVSAYPKQTSSIDEYKSTLQSFGPIFTWEKAPWDMKKDQQEDSLCENSPQVIEDLNKSSTSSPSENITIVDNSLHQGGQSASEPSASSSVKTMSDSDNAVSSEAAFMSELATESADCNFRSVRLKPVTSKGKPDLMRSKLISTSTECVFAEIQLKPVAKTNDKWRKSQISLSAGRIKNKPKGRDLFDLFSSSSQEISQKNNQTANTATAVSAKFSSNINSSKSDAKFISQLKHSEYEKPVQNRKTKTVAEKFEKASQHTVSKTNASSKSKGVGAKFEASIKESTISSRNVLYTSPAVTKNNLTDTNPSKPLATNDFHSGRVLGKVRYWQSAETALSGNIAKKKLGAIGKSNSNNAILEGGSKSYLDKDQDRLEQKRHSLQMNIAPTLPVTLLKNVQHAEINDHIPSISQGLNKSKKNLQAAGLNQTSHVVKKREIFEIGDKQEQQNKKQTDFKSVNTADLHCNNVNQADSSNYQDNNIELTNSKTVKVNISQDESGRHKDLKPDKTDISQDKNVEKTYSRTVKVDIYQDKNVETTHSRTEKVDMYQDNSVQINRVELNLNGKGVVNTVSNEHNAKPEWMNRKPVSNIEAKIKGNNTAVSQPGKPEWVSLKLSKYNKETEHVIENKNRHELNTSYRNVNKDEQNVLMLTSGATGGGGTFVKSFQTNVSKQSGSRDSDSLKDEDKNLFSERSPKPKPFCDDADTEDICKVQAANNDTVIQAMAAITTVDLPGNAVAASAKLAPALVTATNTVTSRFVGNEIKSTIPEPADATPVLRVRNRNVWKASTRVSDTTVDQTERSKLSNKFVNPSHSRASNILGKELQGNNFSKASSTKLFLQPSTESTADDQHSDKVKNKHLRPNPVYPAHGTGISSNSEHYTSSMDDSESVLSTASISSSSSDASNVTVDSGYPRNSSRSFVDNEKRGLLSEVLHHENSGSCATVHHSKSFDDEVNSKTVKAWKIKENILEDTEMKKNGDVSKPGEKDTNTQILTRDQKHQSGFTEVKAKTSNGEAHESIPRSKTSERRKFMEESRIQAQDVLTQESKESENLTDIKENEDVADLTKDFGTTRKYSKKRRKHQTDTNEVVSETSSYRPGSSIKTDEFKSRFGHEFRNNDTENKPVALRPSDLDLSHHRRSSRGKALVKDVIPAGQSHEKRTNQTTSTSATTYSLSSEQQQQLCPPSFPMPLRDTSVMYGSKTVLQCQVIGNPRPEVKWLLNQTQIEPSKNITILYSDDIAQLSVRETFAEHVGDYTCWARNSLGTVSSHCTLILEAFNKSESRALEGPVFSPPKIVSLLPSSVSLVPGSPFTLTANFVGEPPPQVKWMQGDRELLSGSHAHIVTEHNTSCLTIKSISQSDAGKMSVCLTSCTGTDQATTNICIEDIPGAPVGRPHVYDIDKNSACLSWYSPLSNEGNQVAYYIIEAKTRQDNTWDVIVPHCQDVSCHILGLKPCTTYQFRVLAANKNGVSAPSEPSERVLTSDPFMSPSDYESDDDFPFEPREVQINTADKFENVYELDKEVGKGKFGTVFKCKHKADGTVWAAKIVKCREKDKSVIRREIEIMNKLRHPKLLLLWDAYESPKQMVLVMEYIGAGELFERVIGEDFVLTEADCIHFLRQICEGVNYMHSNNILHLDLKPENILCLAENSNRIKIIDFGLAQFYKPGQSTKVLFGTPEFIAPEVINYDEIGFETDMWSVGVICYVLLSGLSPFLGDSDAETLANVTSGEFDFDDEAFDEISSEAKHFMYSLLVMKKEQRMLTDQCLAHVWLNQSEVGRVRSRRLNTERLKRFMVRRKWLKTGNAVLAVSRLLKSSNLSIINSSSAGDNIGNTSQLSDKSPISTPRRKTEEVVDNETTAVGNCITQYPDIDLDHASEHLPEIGEDKGHVKENSAFLDCHRDLSETTELSQSHHRNSVSNETLTQTTESSVNVVQLAGVTLIGESRISLNTDQNDNQVMNESSQIVAPSGTDVNHNMKPSTSSFTGSKYSDTLSSSSSTAQIREGKNDRRTEIKQSLMSNDCDRVVLQAPVFTKSMINSNTCVGDVARFDVTVLGDPLPHVTWYFEDEEISLDSRHTLDCNEKTRSFSLIIRSIEEEDEGEYSCKAINSQGESVCKAELSVLEM